MMPWLRRNIQRDFNSLPISENFYKNNETPPLKWFKCREDPKNVFVQWQTKFEKPIQKKKKQTSVEECKPRICIETISAQRNVATASLRM